MSRTRKALGAVRYASRKTGVDFEKWLVWGAIAGGFYFVSKLFNAGAAVKTALNEAGSKIGLTAYDWFHPNEVGETTYFAVKFPDGSFHSVPAGSIDAQGVFTNKGDGVLYKGDGKRYRIAISPSVLYRPNGTPAGNKYAVLL